MSTTTRIGGWVAVVALGLFLALTVLPPPGGPVPVPRSLNTDLTHLLWPWTWHRADPRLVLVLPLLVTGLALWRRPAWLATVAVLPVAVEAWQYAVPGLGQTAAARDLAHAWIGLTTGALLGVAAAAVVRCGARVLRGRRRPVRVLVPVATVTLVLLVVSSAWPSGETEAVADPVPGAQGPLLGADRHGEPVPAEVTAWIGAGTVPGAGTTHEDMARAALRDLRLLTEDLEEGSLPAAGPAPRWDFFWPRDGAFVAVALGRTGHAADAAVLLDRVSVLSLDPLYGFDARYLVDGDRVVDDPRGAQVDGCGWVLWAIHETARLTPVSAEVHDLRDRCTDQLLRVTGGGAQLAAPSPDYWERATYERLLGANAPLVLGLRSAAADYRAQGAVERASVVGRAASELREVVGDHFGPDFQRTRHGGGLDAATAMLMPPFDPQPLPGVREAWLGYQESASRPAGGLAPGAAWKQDGVSWTPEVALVAYTAAADGQDTLALEWLDWLDAHRAPWGSLPEKVGPAGEPGGPAPLGWTSALVLLTLSELA
ncbi:glycoside hydrolase family 15 [Ornithinimicrobium cavernae]|uniref:glycoside hydrolase family 15 n=1 Tax=Ornithinimicrobium cavernae TaxID=2666047 RepID=UPI000D68E017|nr:glycoside hydrolase family 15 [Ornithinimicrobium cavernae]